MERAIELLVLGVGVIVLCVYILMSKQMGDTGVDTSNRYNNRITEVQLSIANNDKEKYNGVVVSGADVMNVIRRYTSEGIKVDVTVKNMVEGDDGVYHAQPCNKVYTVGYEFPKIGTEEYINPAASFRGTVVEDENKGFITKMTFVQQNETYAAEPADPDSGGGGSNGGSGGNGEGSGSGGGYAEIGEDSMAALNDAITSVASSLEIVSGQLATLLNNGNTDHTGDGSEASASSSSIANSLAEIERELNQLTNAVNNSDVAQKVDTLTGVVSSLQTAVGDLQTSVNNSSHSSASVDLSGVQSSLTAINQTLTALQNTVATKNDVNALKDSVTSTSNSNSVVSRVGALEQKVGQLTNAIQQLTRAVDTLQHSVGTGGT